MPKTPIRTDFSRVFLIPNRAGPSPDNAPQYNGNMRAASATWDQGKVTPVYIPDPNQYGQFLLIDKVPGEPTLPTMDVEAQYLADLDDLLALMRRGCDNDVQVHIGACGNPRDFDFGWEKIIVLQNARVQSWATKDLGALEPSQRAQITETSKLEGTDLYEIKKLIFAQKAAGQVDNEVVALYFCDSAQCGTCGIPSDGCNVLFMAIKGSAGSPGLLPSVAFTTDGGLTFKNDVIDSIAANDDPTDIVCVGPNVVVLSSGAGALEWTAIADLVAGVETWTEMKVGFVAGKGPTAVFSPSQSFTYIVGVGGYIYFSTDPTSSVSVLDAGVASVNDWLAVHGLDVETLVCVGKNNSVAFTANAGDSFEPITGPLPGADLTTVFMHSINEWFVGTSTGRLFYTRNQGATWAEKSFPGAGAGVVRDIKFSNDGVGYMAHSTGTPRGRILRTVNGGNSWYVLPEGNGTLPTNQRITKLAVCANINAVWGGGLNAAGNGGIVVAGL